MHMDRQGIRSRRWMMDGAVCLQRGCRGCGSRNIIPSFEKRVLMQKCIYNAGRARMGSGNGIRCQIARTTYAMVCKGRAMAMLVRAQRSALVTHTRFLGGVGSRRVWTDSCGTLISLVLLCYSGKGIGKRVVTRWVVQGASNVVHCVGQW